MEFLTAANLDRISVTAVLSLVALAVITGKLLWHKTVERQMTQERERTSEASRRADRWESIAIEALTAGAQAGVKAAEVAVGVVSAIPDPVRDRARRD